MSAITQITSWLKKPFPAYKLSVKNITWLALFFAFFVSFILLMIGFNSYQNHNDIAFKTIPFFALITFLSVFFTSYSTSRLFPNYFADDSWTIGKQIFFSIVHILVIIFINSLYAYFANFCECSFGYILLANSLQTTMIGIPPAIILAFWIERKYYKKHFDIAESKSKDLRKNKGLNRILSNEKKIKFESGKEKLDVLPSNLFFVKAEGNYCRIFFCENDEVKKVILRLSLKKVEDITIHNKRIVRCHKSYIVNLDKVERIEGNARGYIFFLDKIEDGIPVSRNFPKEVIESI